MPRTLSTSDMVTPGSLSPLPSEPADDKQAGQPLLDGAPSSAPLDTLIQQLVPTADYYPEKAYIFTFLLSSRLFIEPRELLARVCHLCIEQQQLDKPVLDKARVRKFGPKLLQLLAEWTETFPRDFQEESAIRHLEDVASRITPCDEHGLSPGDTARLAPDSRTKGSARNVQSKKARRHAETAPHQAPPPGFCQQQMALRKPCFSDKTNNLEAYVKWFNRLCYLVATEICMSLGSSTASVIRIQGCSRKAWGGRTPAASSSASEATQEPELNPLQGRKPAKKKQRVQVIEFFTDVARECFNIGNFNSLMAIISGMNMSPVSRLKKTWAKVKTAKFFILEHQMDPTGNFCNYRTALRGAAHRSLTAHSSQEKVVIPFFSLLIKDIYFLNEGCASRLPNGHINFEKFLELAKRVGEFVRWKQVACPFEQNPSITSYLHTAPVFSEDGLYLASYESESPENQTEKERWKSLRSSTLGKT
ncbi:Ras-GEF domain-containing family member 1C [Fukomys damarensis]|uniref:Ras-GEF domain-containing family member 1C n=1 Tax=Fukomys damarensis TaxID=885580 RepID=A0A091DQQ8_FUKDA|nr:Ras-GEF domain-containing family member 1C [Fukomys damarensis]